MSIPDTWHLTTPLLSGQPILGEQKAANHVLLRHGFPWLEVTEDGEFGPDTLRGSRQAAYMLGVLSPELHRIADGELSQTSRALIEDHRKARVLERLAARRRAPLLERRAKHHGIGAAAALAWAIHQAGTTEHPAGTNTGPGIDTWQAAFGIHGAPWCGAFSGYASKYHGGAKGITNRVVYVPYTLYDSQHGINGFVAAVPPSRAKPGDHALYGFGHSYPVHTGLIRDVQGSKLLTVEGNTSSSNSGSQSNGGGVFERERSFSDVIACARPQYG